MDETNSREEAEPPILQRRFTHHNACIASTMSGPRLRKWTTSGALQRFIPLRQEDAWVRFNFFTCVGLALAQSMMELGIGSKRAFAWADEAVRALWESEFYGSLVIYQPRFGAPGFRIIEEIGAEATGQLNDMVLGVYINCRAIANQVLTRLIMSGAVESWKGKGTFSDILRASFEQRDRKLRRPLTSSSSATSRRRPPRTPRPAPK